MRSTKALKMACLSVGLATAWSPLGGQTARADTMIDVNMTLGSTVGDPTTYNLVAIGLVFANSPYYEVHNLGSFSGLPLPNDSYPASYDGFASITEDFDQITGFVTVGFAVDGQVMVSIGSIYLSDIGMSATNWTQLFGSVPQPGNNSTISNLDTFLDTILASPTDVVENNVLTNPFPLDYPYAIGQGQLHEFSPSGDLGVVQGDVSIQAVTVPLPDACLMGGGLFALMALSKRSLKWVQLRQTRSLA